MSATTEKSSSTTAVWPFTVPVTPEAGIEARARVAATRRPDRELVADHSQGTGTSGSTPGYPAPPRCTPRRPDGLLDVFMLFLSAQPTNF